MECNIIHCSLGKHKCLWKLASFIKVHLSYFRNFYKPEEVLKNDNIDLRDIEALVTNDIITMNTKVSAEDLKIMIDEAEFNGEEVISH